MWNAANRAADSLPRRTGCSMPGYGRTIRLAYSPRQIRKFTNCQPAVPVKVTVGLGRPSGATEAISGAWRSNRRLRVKLRKRLRAILPKVDRRGRPGEREQDCCGHLAGITRTAGDTRGVARGSAGYHRAALYRIPDDRRTHCIGRTTYP